MLELRLISTTDFNITYEWAKNPALRQFSFTKSISEEEHKTWFYKKVKDPSCFIFIAEQKKQPCGLIRFDIIEKDALISFLIDPKFQGLGLGKTILEKGINEMLIYCGKGKVNFNNFIGFVMKQNNPSIKSFERLNFQRVDLENKYKFIKPL